MAISDTERREVASKLRCLDEHIDGVPPMCSKQQHNAMALNAIRAVVGKGDIFHLLADLIDRPTCKLVEAWDGEREQHYLDCTACHFGRRAIEQDDAGVWYNARELWCNVEYADLAYCPYCGAEVVR